MNQFNYVILGGGVAGLCAAKRLLELGIQPLVIEAGGYPSHKVCGEFLSPSSLPILKRWDIDPVHINQVHVHTSTGNLQFPLSPHAGSLSHLTLDAQLANQISQQGAILFTHTKVQELSPSSAQGAYHTLLLSTGEKVMAKHLLIAAGRLSRSPAQTPRFRYIGFKAHFSELKLDSTLHMFSFKGAYLGLSPIENGRANLACLAKIEKMQLFPSSQHFMQSLLASHSTLHQLLSAGHNLFEDWMVTHVPDFGFCSTPHWPQTYWIGDAANTIPPACGNGLSLAIASGYLAAEFAARDDAAGFKQAWQRRCAIQIRLGKGLHHLFLHPSLGSAAIRFVHCFPFLAQGIFNLTRDPGL
jgi:flavin-dependent dehydrogenase